ncbi:transmembrane protein 272-like [Leptodactylus fuscus]|uniref:transmembrane protein 272-like n=1 Tax=Leptodactylus fuscus TaxID=238119 RepID=UPI003F4E62E8
MEDGDDNPRNPLLSVVQESFLPKTVSIALKCILVGINISSIVIGVIYFNDCPGQPLIPYYLIVSGGASLLYLFMTCLPCIDSDRVTTINLANLCAQGLMILFLFAFFIVGNVWVYSLYNEPWNDPRSPSRCQRVLYLYAFWMITLCHLCFLVLLSTYLCLLLCLLILKKSIIGGRLS